MALERLFDPDLGQMRVAGLMSGSGTNLRKIIELERKQESEKRKSSYKVVVIFSDNAESNAVNIGKDYDIPIIVRDIRAFYAARNKPRKDMQVREEFDQATVDALEHHEVFAAAYAGYMSIASKILAGSFLGINVHPADLSILGPGKSRRYTGDHAVRDALLAGEIQLRSTTHMIEEKVDYGRILMASRPIDVKLPPRFSPKNPALVKSVADQHQNMVKEAGDWTIFPQTLLHIAEGRFAEDEHGKLYFDGKPIPNGLRLDR